MSGPTFDDIKWELIRGDVFEKYGVDISHHVDESRLAAAIVEVEEAHLDPLCLSDACDHPDGECPEFSIGCGSAGEIAAQYMRKDLVTP